MARDEEPRKWDTGRLAYLQPDEPINGDREYRLRPIYPFWKSDAEEMRYMRAVSLCPFEGSGLGRMAWAAEVAKLAEGIKPELKSMSPIESWRSTRGPGGG